MSLGAASFKTGLMAAATTAWASSGDILVTTGMPAFDPYNDIASFGQVTSSSDPATLGTNRTREETLTCELTLYCFRGGGQEQETVVENRAFELLELLSEYCRVTDTTLGGVVRWCFMTDYASSGATDLDILASGRLQILVATFTAHYRITS